MVPMVPIVLLLKQKKKINLYVMHPCHDQHTRQFYLQCPKQVLMSRNQTATSLWCESFCDQTTSSKKRTKRVRKTEYMADMLDRWLIVRLGRVFPFSKVVFLSAHKSSVI